MNHVACGLLETWDCFVGRNLYRDTFAPFLVCDFKRLMWEDGTVHEQLVNASK